MELTEHAGSKITRLGDAALKNNLITASNGSLVSTGGLGSHPRRARTSVSRVLSVAFCTVCGRCFFRSS